MDASNDYAFADVGSNYGVNKKIPVYVNGEIVFGYPNDPSVWPKRIGVLKKHWDYACDEEVIIRIDAEASPNYSGFDEGETVNIPSVYVGRGIVEFMYCVLVTTILRVTYCPIGLVRMLERNFALCLPIITRTCRILSVANMPFLPRYPTQI